MQQLDGGDWVPLSFSAPKGNALGNPDPDSEALKGRPNSRPWQDRSRRHLDIIEVHVLSITAHADFACENGRIAHRDFGDSG